MIKSSQSYNKLSKIFIIIIGILIILAGSFAILYTPLYILYDVSNRGGTYLHTGRVSIEKINPSSPADSSNLKIGDHILSINGKEIKNAKDAIDIINENKGKPIVINTESNGKEKTVELTPRISYPQGEGPTGLGLTEYEFKHGNVVELVSQIYSQSIRTNPLFTGVAVIISISEIIIGIGLIKFLRWGLIGGIILSTLSIIYKIGPLFSPNHSIQDPFNIQFSIIFDVVIICFLYTKRKLFR